MTRLLSLVAVAVCLAACGSASSRSGALAPAAPTTSTPPEQGPAATATAARAPGADWPTFDYNAARTGVGPARTGIAAADLRRLKLRVVHIDGTVDSAAIELHAVKVGRRRRDAIFVTTSYGRTIAIDPGTGQRLWEFTPRDVRSYAGSDQVTDTTPVADPDRRYVYAAAPDGFVYKLSVASGREVRGRWPVRITSDPGREKMDSPLGVTGGSVIATTGGYYGDAPDYQGHVVLIDRASGRITHVFNTLCSNRHWIIAPTSSCNESDSAIWARAGVIVEPRSGRLLLATGNGDFNGRTDWGDSVLELSPSLRLLHNWTPGTQDRLNHTDTDLGSSAPALVAVGGRRLALQGGKDATLHLLDLDRLNGTRGGAGPRQGGELQDVRTPGANELFTAPAVWYHRGRAYAFVVDDSGTTAYLVSGGRHPHLNVAWQNGNGGTSPVLAGGLLYVYDEGQGALNVYAPASGARVATLRAATGHWNSPIVVGGRIILPVGNYHDHSGTGEIYIWHR